MSIKTHSSSVCHHTYSVTSVIYFLSSSSKHLSNSNMSFVCNSLKLFLAAGLIMPFIQQLRSDQFTGGSLNRSCICPDVYNPVCADNGETYGNPCELNCAIATNSSLKGLCYGECPCCKTPYVEDGCACTMQYDPVCGSNNKTYGNACALKCDSGNCGVTQACKGECPCKCCTCPSPVG